MPAPTSHSSAHEPYEGVDRSARRLPLTGDLRLRLQAKRRSVGLSLNRAASLLGIHPSTLHHWESGHTKFVSRGKLDVLTGFVDGEYDEFIHDRSCCVDLPLAENSLIRLLHRHDELGCLLRQVSDVFMLMEDDRRGTRLLLAEIRALLVGALDHLSSKGPSSTSREDESEGPSRG